MTSGPSEARPWDSPACLDEALAYLMKANDLIKRAEMLGSGTFPVPAINEFRNIACHLARYIRDPSDTAQLEKVARHAKRAYLDANEAYALSLLETVRCFNDAFRGYSHIVHRCLTDCGAQKTAVLELHRGLREHAIGTEDERLCRAQRLEALFEPVDRFILDVEANQNVIQDAVASEKRKFCWCCIGALIVPVSIALLGWVVKLIFG